MFIEKKKMMFTVVYRGRDYDFYERREIEQVLHWNIKEMNFCSCNLRMTNGKEKRFVLFFCFC